MPRNLHSQWSMMREGAPQEAGCNPELAMMCWIRLRLGVCSALGTCFMPSGKLLSNFAPNHHSQAHQSSGISSFLYEKVFTLDLWELSVISNPFRSRTQLIINCRQTLGSLGYRSQHVRQQELIRQQMTLIT